MLVNGSVSFVCIICGRVCVCVFEHSSTIHTHDDDDDMFVLVNKGLNEQTDKGNIVSSWSMYLCNVTKTIIIINGKDCAKCSAQDHHHVKGSVDRA